MDPQLENIEDPLPRFLFQFGESVQVPWVEDERFFADRNGADAQGESHVGIVKIIGRANTDKVDALFASLPAQLFGMPIKPLELGKKSYIVKETVEDPHGIGLVQRGDDPVPGIPDGFHVPRRYISGRPDQGKIFHRPHITHELIPFHIAQE
jgi:hypothetical protein